MTIVRLDPSARIAVPLELRKAAGPQAGDDLEAEITDQGILLRRVRRPGTEPTPDQEAEIQFVVDEERRTYACRSPSLTRRSWSTRSRSRKLCSASRKKAV